MPAAGERSASGLIAKPPIKLGAPLTSVVGVGPQKAAAFAALGVKSVAQLLTYLPTRYERVMSRVPIAELALDAIVSAEGLVSAARVVSRGSRPRFEAVLIDESGRLDLVWFNGLYLKDKIVPGVRLWVQGKSRKFGPGIQIGNPKWRIVNDGEAGSTDSVRSVASQRGGETTDAAAHTDVNASASGVATLRPVYPASQDLSSRSIAEAVQRALEPALSQLDDHLSPAFIKKRELVGLAHAYRAAHVPRDEADAAAGRRRLAYDELLQLMLAMSMKRAQRVREFAAIGLRSSPLIDKAIRKRLPFALTGAQDRVIGEITADLARAEPTNRLIQGDVGSGKTVVALYAMLLATAGKHQAALMAPTELLAEQHFASIGRLLKDSKVRLALLTGSVAAPRRREVLKALATGEIDLIVGTHALLTDRVEFKSLAVIVIDEQHRFGVHQRARLMSKPERQGQRRITPHTLVMTATPIPRTLAMSLLGDLDVSTIDEMPPGRRKVATRVVTPVSRGEVYKFVRARVDAGEQAFVVVPAIEAGIDLLLPESADAPAYVPRSVAEVAAELREGPMKGKRVGEVHGKLNAVDRDAVMQAFRAGEVDVLVATTVIEVGVDIPGATLMVVEDADRFGLAQLHQLRGRVGRGTKASACVLISGSAGEAAHARLSVLAKTSDGFKIAEADLQIRGFGEVVGQKQSGAPPFRVVDLSKDIDLLTLARRDAMEMVKRSPTLEEPSLALLRRRVLKAHGKWLGLADVG